MSEARSAGVGRGRLDGRDLERPFHGIRTGTPATSLEESCEAYLPLIPDGGCFSHTTAALLWGCPLPGGVAEARALHVSVPAPRRAPRGAGVVGHQFARRSLHVVDRNGLPVADPAATWLQVAGTLPLDELVAVGDHLVLDPVVLDPLDIRPHLALDELRERVRGFSGRGARTARQALGLVRLGAESRPETLLRLLILQAGLPEPELNIDILDAAGRVLGRGDLVYRQWRTVVEYDGDQHRSSTRQYERDQSRIESFLTAGWRVVRVRSHGLFREPDVTARRVEAALRAGGWRA